LPLVLGTIPFVCSMCLYPLRRLSAYRLSFAFKVY